MDLLDVMQSFLLDGTVVDYREFGSGHINSTFKVKTDRNQIYVLQKINTQVFRNPEQLMANICTVTEHIRKRGGNALHSIPTCTGGDCHVDTQGQCWRMYDFLEGISLDLPETDEDFYQSAIAFGRFQEQLCDFPAETLYETIPNFHNTPDRYRQLREAVQKDAAGRASQVTAELEDAFALEAQASILQKMLDAGELPLRVTHNDTKLNNVLLDPVERKPLCVLDLDTVMPGLSAYDFGDSIRFGAATAAEDEKDLSKMEMDINLFRVYARGFLEAATSLTDAEKKVLPLGALTMTVEVGIRFLADYLNGDIYFKTDYPEHNLVRARTQLVLAKDMVAKMAQMEQIVAELSN